MIKYVNIITLIVYLLLFKCSKLFVISNSMNVNTINKSRILLINFTEPNEEAKHVKIDKKLNFSSYKDLKYFIQQQLTNEDNFKIEVLNTNLGRYEKVNDNTLFPIWDRGVLSVLVIMETNNNQVLLSIKGRMFDITTGLSINDQVLLINEDQAAHLGTGLNTWDGSVILAKYFECNQHLIKDKRILELGAGTGIAGISTLLLGARFVHLTDLGYALANLLSNIELNTKNFATKQKNYKVSELDWDNEETYPKDDGLQFNYYDVIIGADIVWLEHLIPALVTTLKTLMTPDRNTIFILSHQVSCDYYLDLSS